MEIYLHKTNSLYTQVLQVQHQFLAQSAYAGEGKGQYVMAGGHPQIHPIVLDMLKLDIVYYVVCGPNYFMITVSKPARWGEIEGRLHHIVAHHLRITK